MSAVHPALEQRTCYHRYQVEPGLYTPEHSSKSTRSSVSTKIGIAADLKGTRVLGIGAWDGSFTFELERRSGEVTVVDIQDPDVTVFNAVKSILGSSARYLRANVYD